MKYRMYVDEVGNPDLNSSDNQNHRFLSLTGVIVDLKYAGNTLHTQMEELKTRYFHSHPDDPVTLHRKELLNAKPPFEALEDPINRKNFDRELLRFLEAWEYTVISICLDKKTHRETYKTWRYDPYHYCLALLLERFVFFLEQYQAFGDVLAESRGGKEDRRLKTSFMKLWEEGTQFVEPSRFQNVLTSRQLKIKSKTNNIAGLQLADLIAHPSRNELLKHNNFLDKDISPFGKKLSKYFKRNIIKGKVDFMGKNLYKKGPFQAPMVNHPPPVFRIVLILIK
ncbi:MAG: DUF3800 domain-containing protein [bacterium]